MKSKEVVVQLKLAGLRNSQIAAGLDVSKQYVSRVCREVPAGSKPGYKPPRSNIVTVAVAGRVLGLSKGQIRLRSDQARIPSFRLETGRHARAFTLSDLAQLVKSGKADGPPEDRGPEPVGTHAQDSAVRVQRQSRDRGSTSHATLPDFPPK